MYFDASEAKKMHGPTKSSFSPHLPNIVCFALSSLNFLFEYELLVISVLIYPGPRLFTLIQYFPQSFANALPSILSPPFDATYAGLRGKPSSALMLVILIIEPCLRFFIY